MRRSQVKAVQPASARKPATARASPTAIAESRHRPSERGRGTSPLNHRLAGPPADVAGIVEHARTAPSTAVPHIGAVAREFGLPLAALDIRAGGAARDACTWLGARAFAVQNLVVFAEPAPAMALVRHELAHVVQQDGVARPAPDRFRPGSLTVGLDATAAEADAANVARGAAPKAGGSPVEAVVLCDADPADLKRALARLAKLAAASDIKKFDPAVEDKAPVFGISQGKVGDEEKFDPLFVVSSAGTFRLADYRTAASPALSEADAGADLRDLIFKRPEDDRTKLASEAIANTSIAVGNLFVWATRVVVPNEPDQNDSEAQLSVRKTKSYGFIGAYQSKGATAASDVSKAETNKFPLVNRTGPRRKEPDAAVTIKDYGTIFTSIQAEAKKDGKSLAGIGKTDALPKALADANDVVEKSKSPGGPEKSEVEAQAKAVRDALKAWVLENYTEIDGFYDVIIASSAFPPAYSAIKGDIFVSFIAAHKGADLRIGTEQVYFGKRAAGGKVTKRANLKKLRRADGHVEKRGEQHLLEGKARTEKPNDDELLQMDDYATIVVERIRGFLLKEGKIEDADQFENGFSAVEYIVGNDKDVAKFWNTELKARFAKKGIPKGYAIYPPQAGAKETWIRFNPTARLPIPKPEEIQQSVSNVEGGPKGSKILKADFKLVRPLEPDIESGTISVAVDMGGVVKSPADPGTKPLKPTVDTDAKPEKPGGPVIYGRVENKFEKLGSSIDKFFKERITTDAKMTNDGIEASLRISKGSSGIPGITLDEAVVSATFGARGLAAKGTVGLSNETGTVKGGLQVSWTSSAKQWKVTGDVTFTKLIEGLEPFTAKFTYDPENDITRIHVEKVAIKKTYGGITIKGTATNLELDVKTGAFSGKATITAGLGAFGEASAEDITIEANQIKSATLAYTSPKLAYPKTNPALAGTLKGSVTYTAGKNPGDDPVFGGSIEVDAELRAAPLKKLSKSGKLGVAGKVEIENGKFVRSTIGTTDALTLGQHFRIPPFQAKVDADGALSLEFSLEVIDIGPLKDAKVDAVIDKSGFTLKGADVKFTFGTDKDKVWGALRVIYKQQNLTVGGAINVRIKEGLIAHGEAIYDNDKQSVSATLSINEIQLLKYKSDPKTLVDLSKQVELVSFYKVIGIYLDVGFSLTFVYNFDLRLSPTVKLDDFSFKTFKFSRATAVMKLLGELSATLTGTPNIGLGVFIISTKLLRAGGGIEIPIAGKAALALDPPVTIEVVYTPEGGVSAGGTAGLTLLFGVTGSVKPYADYDVLNGTYKDKWEGQPLTSFTLLKERPIFTYVVNFGKPLTTDKSPPIPEGKADPPAVASTARPLTGKAEGKTTPTEVVRKPEQEKTPEDKPEADSKGGFDLKGMVSGLKSEPKFAKAIAIMDAAAEVWDAISGVVGAIVNFVKKWVGGAVDLIVGIVKAIGKHNLAGFLKEFLAKRLDPLLLHIIEPLIDVIAKVEKDLYELFEIDLPESAGGALGFALTVIKKVLNLAWDSFTELVDAILTMVDRATKGAREFAQYLVKDGRLGVIRRGRYIGSKTVGLTYDFLVADEYKANVGGVTVHELSESAVPSPDKAIGFGLWHALDKLGVEPTTSEIEADSGEAYADYWKPLPVDRGYRLNRKVRGAGAVAANAPAALGAADREAGVALPGMLRRRYEAALGADLSEVRIHTGAAAALAARSVDARAYTSGRDIHFDSGEFAPGTSAGDLLLAHELAHAAWAPRADRRQYGLGIVPATDPSEQMADTVSQRFAAQGTRNKLAP